MYSSLSQTCSNVKMVQSLLPIWEEEHERSGRHEAALPRDPGKPPPEDVLKAFSHGLEFEQRLLELCSKIENHSSPFSLEEDLRFAESMRPTTNKVNTVQLESDDLEIDGEEHLRHLSLSKDNETSLSQAVVISDEESDACPKQLPATEMQRPQIVGSSDVKVGDKEALGLLHWLATSQAAEDINSDDELAREIILSPLLPAMTIDKVLEKANIDFESESQQECQDILDSIEGLNKADTLEKKAFSTDHNFSCQRSMEKMIPQVDGSSDDPNSIDKSSDVEMCCKSEMFLQEYAQQESGSSFTTRRQGKKPLWGLLPFSSTQKIHDDQEPMKGCCLHVTDEHRIANFGDVKAVDKSSCISVVNAVGNVCDLMDASTFVGCSTRDLMRRKRCFRFQCPEYEGQRVKKVSLEKGKDIISTPKDFEALELQNDVLDKSLLAPPNSLSSLSSDIKGARNVKSCMEPSKLNLCGETCKTSYENFQCCGQSISSINHGSFQAHASKDECILPSERFDDVVGSVAEAGSGNFMSSILHSLHKGGEVPDNLSSADQHSAVPIAGCEDNDLIGSEDANRRPPLTSESLVWKRDKLLESNTNDNLLNIEGSWSRDSPGANHVSASASAVEGEILFADDYMYKNGLERRTYRQRASEIPSENTVGMKDTAGLSSLQFYNYGGGQGGKTPDLSSPGSDVFPLIDMGANSFGLSGMTFHKKPPVTVDCTGGSAEDISSLNFAKHISIEGLENYEGISAQGKVADELLPFFVHDSLEGEGVDRKILKSRGLNYHQGVMGIPTHYLNDGSYLYLLTPVYSPPSTERVSQWIFQDDSGSSSSQTTSECSLSSSMDTSSICGMELEAKSSKHLNSDITALKKRAIEELESDGDIITKGKECTDCSQGISQISGPDEKLKSTPLSQMGFRDPASVGGGQQLMLSSVEIQAESRGDLQPDPRFDAINVVVLVFQEDNDSTLDVYVLMRSETENYQRNIDGMLDCKVLASCEEKHLFSDLINVISSMDPDVLMGWDIQGGSLGFLAERASHLGISFLNNISRTPIEMKAAARNSDTSDRRILDNVVPEPSDAGQFEDSIIEDEWGRTHASGVHVGGRVVLNVWRLMRSELKLNMYRVEAVAEAVLRRKVPYIKSNVLTSWFSSGPGQARHRCIGYVAERAKLNLQILNHLDMINRTSELARVFGIDFFSVLSRGSQYRVESMLLRLAHTQNYLAISPGNQQVASQPAMECLPLVMEPESGFYADPVVVLDFQSLYPSMIIAYNLCFSTCLGNVMLSKANILGVTSCSPDINMLQDLKHEILLTPNGVMYVPPKVRKGILPRLLEEILSTRVMVKQAMKKLFPSQQVLHRIFNARQLALKLIANVTYGYTAAGFSGRMPCAELADSIVQCGRRTLEHAISFVNANDKWKARVIYGDTDSMFVLLKGRNVEEAFQIGNEIASAITAMNPNPVTLKMEKVYHPCFLLTKKRYVGYSYETPGQAKPSFDAKGIETVRRDTCGAVAKMMEQSVRLFFEHQDISKVQAYLLRQWTRILSGRVSLQDFVFAKEVRLGTYSMRASSSLPPAAIVATKAMRADPRAEPRYAERIPYVVVHGEPGSRLIDMVVDPMDLLAIDSPYRLNGVYYITKQIIPALQRVFGLVGADLNQWFTDMPRPEREVTSKCYSYATNSHRTRIDYYYLSKHCLLCGGLTQSSAQLCGDCSKNEVAVATALIGRTSKLEKEAQHLAAICRHCGGGDWLPENGVKCASLACSVFYERRKVQKELQALSTVATEAGLYPRCTLEW